MLFFSPKSCFLAQNDGLLATRQETPGERVKPLGAAWLKVLGWYFCHVCGGKKMQWDASQVL